MKEKHKYVTLDDTRYQIKRFMPEVGSYLLNKLINAMTNVVLERMKAIGDITPPSSPLAEQVQVPPDVDENIRRLAIDAFGVLSFEDRAFVQRKAMECCSRMEGENGDTPMPLTNGQGMLLDDLTVIMQLEVETLIFNFHDFFAAGGLLALTKPTAPPV